MLRAILGIAAGLITGAIVVAGVETLSRVIFPEPVLVRFMKGAGMSGYIDHVPLGAKLAVLVAWFAGAFAGGAVAAMIAQRGAWPSWLIGAILFASAAWTMTMIAHPIWMWAGAVIATAAGAGIAGRLFSKRT